MCIVIGMLTKRYAKGLVVATLLLPSMLAHSTLYPFTLADMVSRADFIVVGTVQRIVVEPRKSNPKPFAGKEVTFVVSRVLKGTPPKEIKVSTDQDFMEEATFRQQELALLFLQRTKVGYGVVQGFMGKIPIRNGIATPVHLAGQPEQLPVDKLLAEIERLVKEGRVSPKD